MKRLLLLCTVLLTMGAELALAQNTVTFRVNMRRQRQLNTFQTGDSVHALIFTGPTGFGTPGAANNFLGSATASTADSVFARAIDIGAYTGPITFKFWKTRGAGDGERYESGSDRTYTVVAGAQTLPIYYFNNDSSTALLVTRQVTWTAQMDSLFATSQGQNGGAGPWNDATRIMTAPVFEVLKGALGGVDTLRRVPFSNPPLYRVTRSIQLNQGDTARLKWKFRAFPSELFTNSGYEDGNDNITQVLTTSDTTQIVARPRINFVRAAVNNFTIKFTIDTRGRRTVDTTNRPPSRSIDSLRAVNPTDSVRLFVKGDPAIIGTFQGPWTIDRLSTGGFGRELYDRGPTVPDTTGDLVANDGIYSRIINVVQGEPNVYQFPYKFAVYYPNIERNGDYLDNEDKFGNDHRVTLVPGATSYALLDTLGIIGSPLSAVRDDFAPVAKLYKLEQNYPNPFNPQTTIRFALPSASQTTLKVYDLLGREVATLVNERLAAGSYTAAFNAARLASGVYFYKLKAGDYVQTRKMMLIK